MEKKISPSIINNFDLIRIAAALQVVFRHLFFGVDFHNSILNLLKDIILSFPGVPIFFTVSGFLIFWSYERNAGQLKKYFLNRFLRIYPALWLCLIITVGLLFYDDKDEVILKNSKQFFVWLMGQVTVIQFWTPNFLKFWGEGAPNASLWTICVELQYYFFVPILYFLINKAGKYKWIVLLFFFLSSVVFNHWISFFDRSFLIYKLSFVALPQYLFYFLFGVFFYTYWGKIHFFLMGKFFIWLLLFLPFYLFFGKNYGIELNDYYLKSFDKLIFIILLNFVIVSFAFSFNTLSEKILKGQDFSYGIYIYHMVIINFFIQRGISHSPIIVILIFTLVIAMAAISWFVVEKRALMLKKKIKL